MSAATKIKELTLDRDDQLTKLSRKCAEIVAAVHDCSTDSGILNMTPDDFSQIEADVATLRLAQRKLVKTNRDIRALSDAL